MNEILRTTDILWTKPSELVFYTALGLPIIMAPPLGAHEHRNRAWLKKIGSGLDQADPGQAHQWLFNWLDQGRLARAALNGFASASRQGTYAVEEHIRGNP